MASPSVSFKSGLPPMDFFPKAWASEPLTTVLQGTNIPYALPMPDPAISLVALEEGQVIGQCSTNQAVKYWTHIERLSTEKETLATRLFVSIHKKAVQVERAYLAKIGQSEDQALHSAGIAVLPEHRGHRLGLSLRERQISLCKEKGATTLFCETTNRYSAATVEKAGFTKLAEYPYEQLAEELNHPPLATLQDRFTVWCLKI